MTIGSFCCPLKRKLQTVECLTLVGTVGCRVRTAQPNRSCGAFHVKANPLTRPSQDGRVDLRRSVALLRFNLFQWPARLTLRGFPKLAISDSTRLSGAGGGHGRDRDNAEGTDGCGVARGGGQGEGRQGSAGQMLVVAQVLEGVDRTTAARTCGMDRQTLRGKDGQKTFPKGLFSRRTRASVSREPLSDRDPPGLRQRLQAKADRRPAALELRSQGVIRAPLTQIPSLSPTISSC